MRVGKATGKRLNIVTEEECRGRVERESSDEVLMKKMFDLYIHYWCTGLTWTSTATPSLTRSASLFNACSECRSKISK